MEGINYRGIPHVDCCGSCGWSSWNWNNCLICEIDGDEVESLCICNEYSSGSGDFKKSETPQNNA
jgi:hypothetical protein